MFNRQARATMPRHSIASAPCLVPKIHNSRRRSKQLGIQQSLLGRYTTGTGILTCCPSTTLFSLALGPTNPTLINIAWETLGFRCGSFSLPLKLLMPTFSLPDAPPYLTVRLQCRQERSSTTHTIKYESVASVIDLAPLDFRRRIASYDSGPVSYYALFK